MMYLRQFKTVVLLVTVITSSGFCQGFVSVDHVTGVVGTNKILTETEIVYYIRIKNFSGDTVTGITNGFQIYSPDGASWEPWLSVDTIFEGPPPSTFFDTTYYAKWVEPVNTDLVWCHGCTSDPGIFDFLTTIAVSPAFGAGSDTVGFGGAVAPTGNGVPVGFNEIAWSLSIDRIPSSEEGLTICIDTAMFRNGLNPIEIRWVTAQGIVEPMWDGPHCFIITNQCCQGMRGNINRDSQDAMDISDLTLLIAWLYRSQSPPPCLQEADVNGDSAHDILDLAGLVNYMFKNGPEPAGCP